MNGVPSVMLCVCLVIVQRTEPVLLILGVLVS